MVEEENWARLQAAQAEMRPAVPARSTPAAGPRDPSLMTELHRDLMRMKKELQVRIRELELELLGGTGRDPGDLAEPADVVYVRYYGRPGVNVIRACLHLLPAVKHDAAVKITHGYKLDGKLTHKAVSMKAPGEYKIDCPGKVENVFIRVEKPSS